MKVFESKGLSSNILSSAGKRTEVPPRTPDVKSGPTRNHKGLRLQLMCCTPFRLLSQYFGTEVGGRWKIGVDLGVGLGDRREYVFDIRTEVST